MKNRSPIWTVALALLGLLGIAVGMIALGKRDDETFPSASSYGPSGASALQELVRRSGYTVVVDHSTSPALKKGDVAIAFYPTISSTDTFGFGQDDEDAEAARQALGKYVKEGGKLLSLPVTNDFPVASRTLLSSATTVESKDGSRARVEWDQLPAVMPLIYDEPKAEYTLWSSRNAPLATVRRIGAGTDALFAEGLLATNRFIDREENARVVMDTLRKLAKPGSRVVFVEAAFGNAENPSLMELIGPWAKAGWTQLLFLGIVIIYTLGKPFGMPDPDRRKIRGSRELLDAMANTLRRGRMTSVALRSVHEDTNRLLRKWFRRPRDTDHVSPEAQHLASLRHALSRVEAAMELGAPEDEAAGMVRDVERLVRDVAIAGAHPYRPGS